MNKNNSIFTLNLKFNYNAAFLFYNLKGIIAEKWAHDYFDRFIDNIGALQIENKKDKRFCLYGLKSTDIYLQELKYNSLYENVKKIKELSNDIVKVINISEIKNIESTIITIYKIEKSSQLLEKVEKSFLKLKPDFFPETSYFYDVGIMVNYEINKFKHNLSFGPFTEENIPRFFRYPFDFITNSLIFVFTTKIEQNNLDIVFDKQKEYLNKIIDINIDNSNKQIEKVLKILEFE